jgi:anti-sigma factor RsiW
MNCTKKYELLISRYLNNDLPEEQAEELKKHINTCDACSSTYNTYKNLQTALDFSFNNQKKEKPVLYKNSLLRIRHLLFFSLSILL